jgi:holo-[acyl-carrier protein] synthase
VDWCGAGGKNLGEVDGMRDVNRVHGSDGVLGVGVDLASVPRLTHIAERYSDAQLALVFTPGERARASVSPSPGRSLGICFAGKEAVGKALGCGLSGIEWTDVDVRVAGASLDVELGGAARRRAAGLGAGSVSASWSAWGGELVAVIAVLQP